jgi:DNA-binding HxlR family transcriptional regulator
VNTDIVLAELRRVPRPRRSVDIWKVIGREISRSGISTALIRLEKQGVVKRVRRFDQDGDEIASHWSLL